MFEFNISFKHTYFFKVYILDFTASPRVKTQSSVSTKDTGSASKFQTRQVSFVIFYLSKRNSLNSEQIFSCIFRVEKELSRPSLKLPAKKLNNHLSPQPRGSQNLTKANSQRVPFLIPTRKLLTLNLSRMFLSKDRKVLILALTVTR